MIRSQDAAPLFASKFICHPANFSVRDLYLPAWPMVKAVVDAGWLRLRNQLHNVIHGTHTLNPETQYGSPPFAHHD